MGRARHTGGRAASAVLLSCVCLSVSALLASAAESDTPQPVPVAPTEPDPASAAAEQPAAPVAGSAAAEETSRQPAMPPFAPAISVDTVQSVAANETLQIRARVEGAEDLDNVYVNVRGALDPGFHRMPMRPDGEGNWTASLGPTPQRGDRLVYFIEAIDASDHTLAMAGSARAPWVVRVVDALPEHPSGRGRLGITLGLLLLAALGGAAGFVWIRSRREGREACRARDEQFWRRLLDPLFDAAEGAQRDAAIEALCARTHLHPDLGSLVLGASEVRRRLEGLRGTPRMPRSAGPLPAARLGRRAEDPLVQVEEDIFWLRLLTPLRTARPREREAIYHNLCSRPHSHPTRGKVMIERAALQREFELTRRMSLEQLQLRWRRMKGIDGSDTPAAAGATKPAPSPGAPSPESHRMLDEAAAPAAEPLAVPAPSLREMETSGPDVPSEMFWYNLLAPLRELPPGLQQDALRELSGRPQRHPVEGYRLFSRTAIAREFEWVKDADPQALQARWNAATLAMLQVAEQSCTATASDAAVDEESGIRSAPDELSPADDVIGERLDELFACAGDGSAVRDDRS